MSERNWQEDWDMCEKATTGPWRFKDGTKRDERQIETTWIHPQLRWTAPIVALAIGATNYVYIKEEDARLMAESREALPYWLQEIKRLKRELAAALCDHEREKSMRVSLATLAEGERRRAEAAEMKLEAIKEMLIEEDEIDRECMMMARAQQG